MIQKWYKLITVEVTMFLYMMAFMVTTVSEQVFFVYKACRVDHGYEEDICRNIQDYDNIKKEVQKTVSLFHQWDNIAGHVIPIVLALFLGAWSDRYGRKLPLLLGLFGKLIYSVMIIVNANQPTWGLNYVIYTATIPCAFTGADIAIFASCFAYISDITTTQERTLRITILDATYLSTMPLGIIIGGQLFKLVNGSFGWMFFCNASLLLISLIYSIIRLKWQTTDAQVPILSENSGSVIGNFFNKRHVKKSLNVVIKQREGYGRLFIWTMLFSMGFYTFQRDERPMLYLFTQLQLNWNTHIYSWFRTYQSSAYVIMMLFGIPLMTKLLKYKDTTLIMIGALSHILGRLFFIYSLSTMWMYVGATVASLGPIVAPVLRSMSSKIIPFDERGAFFSLLSVFDNAVPFVSAPLYSQIYNLTIDSYPAAIFWLTISTQVVVFAFSGLLSKLKGNNTEPLLPSKDKIEVPSEDVNNEKTN